jgi:hypothetical protein
MDMIVKKEHLTREGFVKILSIKSVFPKGLSSKVLESYKNVSPIVKPIFKSNTELLHPNWIAGFIQADGSFGLNYTKQIRMKLGYTCQPQFRICQHKRDLIVLNRIITTMGCGTLMKPTGYRDEYNFSVANLKELLTIVIPFFEKISYLRCKIIRL